MIIHPEVANALARGDAVVALESTIISHGMPYPQNVETARDVEATVRRGGAIPATIAILGGLVHVGLSDENLEKLGKLGHSVTKVSRRDLAVVIGSRGDGATTVSSTMMIAARAGIKVFVTGGVGGVHRGAESTMDISADLTELGRTAVAVVCAGVKSILDIGRTLEYLETQGVTVLGYGTDDFPAFFSRQSGFKVQPGCNMPSAHAVAKVMEANRDYRVGSGMLVAVPIPEEHAAGPEVAAATEQALKEAEEQGIQGAQMTPFLLERVAAISGGDSLASNIALVKNNAEVGARIAVAYSYLKGRPASALRPTDTVPAGDAPTPRKAVIRAMELEQEGDRVPIVLGGIGVDIIAQPHQGMKLVMGSSTPGVVKQTVGGVGGNIARAMATLGAPPLLLSSVGTDAPGNLIRQVCKEHGMDTAGFMEVPKSATYHAVLDETGDMSVAIADMGIFNDIGPALLEAYEPRMRSSSFMVIDGNVPAESIAYVCGRARVARVPVWFEPTSVAKSVRILQDDSLAQCTVVSPNKDEVLAMAWALRQKNAAANPKSGSTLLQAASSSFLSLMGRAAKIVVEETVTADPTNASYEHRRNTQNAPVNMGAGQAAQQMGDIERFAPKATHREVLGWSQWPGTSQSKDEVVTATCELLEAGVEHVVVTLGGDGVLLGSLLEKELGVPLSPDELNQPRAIRLKHIPAIPVDSVVDVTGAGDCLVAGTVFSLLRSSSIAEVWTESRLRSDTRAASEALERAIAEGGMLCARAAVQSEDAVPSSLRGMVEFSTPESTEAKL